jgi:hypothetical protein
MVPKCHPTIKDIAVEDSGEERQAIKADEPPTVMMPGQCNQQIEDSEVNCRV